MQILKDGAAITAVTAGSTPVYVPGFEVTPLPPATTQGLHGTWLQIQSGGVDVGDANVAVLDIVAEPERLLVTRGVGENSHVVTLRGIPPADPYADNVILLLHGDGANGGTVFTDHSQYNNVGVVTGSITTATDSSAFAGSSIRSLSGDTQNNVVYNLIQGIALGEAITLEFWGQVVDFVGTANGYADGRGSALRITNGSAAKQFEWAGWIAGSSNQLMAEPIAQSYAVADGTARFFYAFVQDSTVDGGTSCGWIDGVASFPAGVTAARSYATVSVGNPALTPGRSAGVKIEEVRITRGVNRYAAYMAGPFGGQQFVPPTTAFPNP